MKFSELLVGQKFYFVTDSRKTLAVKIHVHWLKAQAPNYVFLRSGLAEIALGSVEVVLAKP